MRAKSLFIISTIALTTPFASSLFGATLTLGTQSGSIQSASQAAQFETNGARMSGMEITAYFYSAASPTEMVSEALTWQSLDERSGGVSGNGWSLTQSGDTFRSAWTLITDSTSLVQLVIDAGPGSTVFDLTTPESGTPGSARGASFSLIGSSLGGVSVGYSDLVALEGQAPVGDLYRQLTIDFESRVPAKGLRSLTFFADTDKLALESASSTVPAPVPAPIPAAVWLFGSGLLGLLTLRRNGRSRRLASRSLIAVR